MLLGRNIPSAPSIETLFALQNDVGFFTHKKVVVHDSLHKCNLCLRNLMSSYNLNVTIVECAIGLSYTINYSFQNHSCNLIEFSMTKIMQDSISPASYVYLFSNHIH